MPDNSTPSSGKETVDTGRSTRRRSKGKSASTQSLLPISEIKRDTVVLKSGGIRAVLEVSSMNFSLKSEEEQEAIIGSYQQFINTISFPIQIVVRSRKLNIDSYLATLREQAQTKKNPLIKEQTLDYINFIDRLIDVSDIMQKNFYLIVPADEVSGSSKISFFTRYFGFLMGGGTSGNRSRANVSRFDDLSSTLRDRVNIIQAGLTGVGLHSERLTTSQLIELYYKTYNPETSAEQPLPGLDDLNIAQYMV